MWLFEHLPKNSQVLTAIAYSQVLTAIAYTCYPFYNVMLDQSFVSIGSDGHCNKGTQLPLDPIEAAYLSGGIIGMINIGNSCYMNCVMQCLSHTLEMTDIFLTNDYTSTMCSGMWEGPLGWIGVAYCAFTTLFQYYFC